MRSACVQRPKTPPYPPVFWAFSRAYNRVRKKLQLPALSCPRTAGIHGGERRNWRSGARALDPRFRGDDRRDASSVQNAAALAPPLAAPSFLPRHPETIHEFLIFLNQTHTATTARPTVAMRAAKWSGSLCSPTSMRPGDSALPQIRSLFLAPAHVCCRSATSRQVWG